MLKNRRSTTPTKDSSISNKRSPESRKTSASSLVIGGWNDSIKETVLVSKGGEDGGCGLGSGLELVGGADEGQFPVVGRINNIDKGVDNAGLSASGDGFEEGDVVLEIQGQKVSGYTRADVKAWLRHCLKNRNPVVVKTARKGRGKMRVDLTDVKGTNERTSTCGNLSFSESVSVASSVFALALCLNGNICGRAEESKHQCQRHLNADKVIAVLLLL